MSGEEQAELRPRIVLGLPSHDGTYKWNTQLTLEAVISHLQKRGFEVARSRHKGSQLHRFRHDIAQYAIEMGAVYVLYIDADTVCLDMAVLDRMLDANVDIVSAVTVGKQPKFVPLAAMWNEEQKNWWGLSETNFKKILHPDVTELIEVDAVGFGFILIKTSVFEGIPKEPGILPRWFGCVSLSGSDRPDTNEDYYFCWRAKLAGFKIHLDTGCETMYHTGDYEFGIHDTRTMWKADFDRRLAAAKAGQVGNA